MAKKPNKKVSRRDVADQLRNQQKRADQRQGAVIVGVCIVIAIAIIGFAAWKPVKEWWDLRAFNDIDLAGIGAPAAEACEDVFTKPATGNQEHRPEGTPIEYDEVPPAYGPHWGTPDTMDRKLYTSTDRPPLERLVHNLEHGYTFIWYDETIANDDEQMTQLRAIATKLKGTSNPRLKFKAVPWTSEDGDAFPEGTHIVINHWSRGGKEVDVSEVEKQVGVWQHCSSVSGEALYDFMQEYDYFDSPEPNGM
ncbi:DUF3105 domain-containing protein [Nocardioides sp. AE5]|uniref:DUF3105 domain-containing protein n=1 Tax=Nocardioides sp. AE5 TaxID=2962573 RepID=UPI002881F8AB|nr:DUF3105 domain-containing protein [Nocardioides sp. AE5]MDT0201893.1 DUF3105 domain-containing protein [Nocardioides sp. AE5]